MAAHRVRYRSRTIFWSNRDNAIVLSL